MKFALLLGATVVVGAAVGLSLPNSSAQQKVASTTASVPSDDGRDKDKIIEFSRVVHAPQGEVFAALQQELTKAGEDPEQMSNVGKAGTVAGVSNEQTLRFEKRLPSGGVVEAFYSLSPDPSGTLVRVKARATGALAAGFQEGFTSEQLGRLERLPTRVEMDAASSPLLESRPREVIDAEAASAALRAQAAGLETRARAEIAAAEARADAIEAAAKR